MILWIVKLISSVRRAVAGRKYPHQLAWAVAFGLLLGVVPHGNLLAVAVLLVVLSLKINHAMAGLTAVAVTFVATKLDPYSHQVGEFVLTHPQVRETASNAWQLPLMPWTDLNNTVVLGSLLIGVGALLPVFMITYPMFRLVAPRRDDDADDRSDELVAMEPTDARKTKASVHQVVLVDPGHDRIAPPHRIAAAKGSDEIEEVDFIEVDDDQNAENDGVVAVDTRIDVIRMKDHGGVEKNTGSSQGQSQEDPQPMDEALNYLLRQLRDSQQRKAA